MNQKQIQTIFFFVLMTAIGVLAFYLLYSYLIVLAVALALAVLFRPVFNWFRRWARAERGPAALFVTLLVFFVVTLPFTGLVVLLGREVGDVYGKLQQFVEAERLRGAEESSQALHWIAENLRGQLSSGGGVASVLSFISRNAVSVFSGITGTFFGLFLFFVSFYYFMKDGHVFRKMLFGISPLSDVSEAKIYQNVLVAINAVMRGTLIIAAVQGTLAGFGFWMFGIGAPILLGALTMFASLIPLLGTSIVLVPAIAYLFVKGSVAAGIGLTVWGGIAVGLVDNILKPKLIEQRMKIHPLLILLSILGGIDAFGFTGFIIGPLVLAIAWALAEIYREEYHPHLEGIFGSNTE